MNWVFQVYSNKYIPPPFFQSPIFSPLKRTESPLVPFIINLPACKLWVRVAVLVFLPAKTQSFPSAKSP